MIMDLQPGRVVEFDGELHLVETVHLEVTMQKIVPMRPLMERNVARWDAGDYQTPSEAHHPVFTKIMGELGEDVFNPDRLKLLYPDGEAE